MAKTRLRIGLRPWILIVTVLPMIKSKATNIFKVKTFPCLTRKCNIANTRREKTI